MDLDPSMIVRSSQELDALYGPALEQSVLKQMDRLDELSRAWIAASPMVIVSSAGAGPEACADNSPRGDRPGFVHVADDRTLLIPDRRGDNRTDTIRNVVGNPRVGLLFLIPGVYEMFRVNGDALISRDPSLLARFEIAGSLPRTVMVVTVREALVHCSRALVRADLWNPGLFAATGAVPSFGEMMAAHTRGFVDAALLDEENRWRVPATLY